MWNTIKKPISYDPSLFLLIETAKETKERNLTELQSNIYMLFDYQIHQYWCDNYFQPEFALNPSKKSMFGRKCNMYLIVHSHDDWQFRFSDKSKRIFNQFIKDNINAHREWNKNTYNPMFQCYQDLKAVFGDGIVRQTRHFNLNQTSIV